MKLVIGFLKSLPAVAMLLAQSGYAADHEHHSHQHHSPHVHGEAQIFVAIDNTVLEIMFQSPAVNLTGFEHAAESDAQKKQITTVVQTLRNPLSLFELPGDAGCLLKNAEIHVPEYHDHDRHADFEAHYSFHCESPEKLMNIETSLLGQFKLVEKIRVQAISERGQRAVILRDGQSLIEL